MGRQTLKSGGKPAVATKEKSQHYVNNEEFYNEMVEYLSVRKDRESRGLPPQQIPNCIGQKIFKIAECMSRQFNFIRYSWRDEMVEDAVVKCLTYIDRFDPNKTKNPFAYFNQICYFEFLARIRTEKKERYIKMKLIQNMGSEFIDSVRNEFDGDEDFQNTMTDLLQLQGDSDLERLFEKQSTKNETEPEDKVVGILDLMETSGEEI